MLRHTPHSLLEDRKGFRAVGKFVYLDHAVVAFQVLRPTERAFG